MLFELLGGLVIIKLLFKLRRDGRLTYLIKPGNTGTQQPGGTAGAPASAEAQDRLIAIGALLPDLIDKTLAF